MPNEQTSIIMVVADLPVNLAENPRSLAAKVAVAVPVQVPGPRQLRQPLQVVDTKVADVEVEWPASRTCKTEIF
jgi:hypothetical protein